MSGNKCLRKKRNRWSRRGWRQTCKDTPEKRREAELEQLRAEHELDSQFDSNGSQGEPESSLEADTARPRQIFDAGFSKNSDRIPSHPRDSDWDG